MDVLQAEYQHYLENLSEYVEMYAGKVIAIKDGKVIGVYDDYMQAANDLYPEHEKGTVLIQEVGNDPTAHVAVFHTPGIVGTPV